MTKSSRIRSRRSVLSLHSLEARDVPATASVITVPAAVPASGLLSIIGDDKDSSFTVKLEANKVTLTPTDAGTQINTAAPGAPVIVSGTVKSLNVKLFGGKDSFIIDNANDFLLSGAATFDMGDGNNTLNMTTSGKVELGSLSVKGKDGDDAITLSPGVGLGKVSGAASFDLGLGAGSVTLLETQFLGSSGVSVKLDSKEGQGTVSATNVIVSKGVKLTGGLMGSNSFTGCAIGGLTFTGTAASVALTSSQVNGNVSMPAGAEAILHARNSKVTGDVNVKGSFLANVYNDLGTFSANNVTITGGVIGEFAGGGTSNTINGNLSVSGKLENLSNFTSSALSEVKGSLTFKGGNLINTFAANSNLQVDKDVNLTVAGPVNSISLGTGTSVLSIGGNLNITTAGGTDVVKLDNVAVAKNTKINLGGGADSLTINNASSFGGTFSADLGSGDDTVSIAQPSGAAAAVTFTGKATIKGGAGNDTLLLGKVAGDAGQTAKFVAGGKVDGGTGFNTFDDANAAFTGITFPGDFPNWN